jgi:urease accessory protein
MAADPKATASARRLGPTAAGIEDSESGTIATVISSVPGHSAHPAGQLAPCAGEAGTALTLARLMTWLSPAFPVGSFSYSHGLEWAVETRAVGDCATLGDWIEDILIHGAGRTDAIFLAEAWRALAANVSSKLCEVAELAAAFAPTAERRLETLAQGSAFLAAVTAVWPHPRIGEPGAREEIAYPVAVGVCAAAHGLPLAETTQAFLQAFAGNLVSAGVRLIPLGQTDGLRAIARLEPLIPRIAASALGATLDDIGGIAVAADIASMRHETQYTRLFRS